MLSAAVSIDFKPLCEVPRWEFSDGYVNLDGAGVGQTSGLFARTLLSATAMSSSSSRQFWLPDTIAPGSDIRRNELTEAAGAPTAAPDVSLDGLYIYNPHSTLPLRQQAALLPIHAHRRRILYALQRYQTVILVASTGSGKSTQLPQYIHSAGWLDGGRRMAITQPRRIAAQRLARRVSEEMGVECGKQVGYRVRFDDCSDADATRVLYMTDGLLLRELMDDPLLSDYSVVMVDEAHERSTSTDLLLALLRKLQRKRPQLRLIIASATLSATHFLAYFNTNQAPNSRTPDTATLLTVEGRQYPVDIYYTAQPVRDYVQAAVETVLRIDREEREGDVLVFVTGREEVEGVVQLLREAQPSLRVLSLYASLPVEQQQLAFEPAPVGVRKVIVSTNVAEASLTVDGIVYVIDSGFVKVRSFSPTTLSSTLSIVPVSQHSAQQRAGRAGRTRPGRCYRLYTTEAYKGLSVEMVAEMQRVDLTGIVLQLKALGVDDVARFPFISPPPAALLLSAVDLLYTAGALSTDGTLTTRGQQLALLPVDVFVGVMLLSAIENDCVEEMLSIAAMLCVPPVWVRSGGSLKARDKARKRRMRFAVEEGDHLTLLNVYNNFTAVATARRRSWCIQHSLHYTSLMQATHIRQQLAAHLAAQHRSTHQLRPAKPVAILRSLTGGFFHHAARRAGSGGWVDVRSGLSVVLDSESVLCELEGGVEGGWLVYHELVVEGSEGRRFMRCVSVVNSEDLAKGAPHYYELRPSRLSTTEARAADHSDSQPAIKHRKLF